MKKYIQEIFPRLLKLSKTLDNLSILVDQTWLAATEDSNERKVFIFLANKELIVSTNGVVKKGKWEYIANAKSIVIELGDKINLFNQTFIDDKILLLKQDGNDELLIFGNENKLKDFELEKYIETQYRISSARNEPIGITQDEKSNPEAPRPIPDRITNEKSKKEKLTGMILDLKSSIRDLRLFIGVVFVLFLASLIAGIWVTPFLILTGIFGLFILLEFYLIKSDKTRLRETEKELLELNDNNVI